MVDQEKIVKVTSESEVKVAELGIGERYVKKQVVREFMFDDTEIEDFSDLFRDIIIKKRGKKEVSKIEQRCWKLAVANKVAHPEVFILKPSITPITCSLCGVEDVFMARCSWIDRSWKPELNKFVEYPYSIPYVCVNCLNGSKAKYLYISEWLQIIDANGSKAKYTSLHNAKSFVCSLCNAHESDSTWIFIPWENRLLRIAVCDNHFDLLVGGNIDKTGHMTNRLMLGNELTAMLSTFTPIRNKNVKKQRGKRTMDGTVCSTFDDDGEDMTELDTT